MFKIKLRLLKMTNLIGRAMMRGICFKADQVWSTAAAAAPAVTAQMYRPLNSILLQGR